MDIVIGIAGMPYAYDDLGRGIVFRCELAKRGSAVLVFPHEIAVSLTGQLNATAPPMDNDEAPISDPPSVKSSDVRSAGPGDTVAEVSVHDDGAAVLSLRMQDGGTNTIAIPYSHLVPVRKALSKVFLRS